jgi:hypothetical protein
MTAQTTSRGPERRLKITFPLFLFMLVNCRQDRGGSAGALIMDELKLAGTVRPARPSFFLFSISGRRRLHRDASTPAGAVRDGGGLVVGSFRWSAPSVLHR